MTPERWRQVTAIFHAARGREPALRGAFLDQACRDDASLRAEVDSLLAGQEEAGRSGTGAVSPGGLPQLSPGTAFGPYRIESLIGSGGMGQVYRASDPRLRRTVAIKVLTPGLVTSVEVDARFAREARLLASLNHPNIAAIHGLEDAQGVAGLVLEYVEGPTLAERLAKGPVPVHEALTLARQIALALEAAHEKGIIHRDLKPSNIKTTPAGVVKILDFGIARLATDAQVASETTMGATGTGMILGTPAYMSPEQARGQEIDKRTDVWAFGCVLYEMVTGRGAFAAATASDSLARLLEREPDWTALPGGVPAPIQRLIRRCLHKSVTERLHDIADARLEIEDTLATPTHTDSRIAAGPARSASLRLLAATTVIALVIGAILGWLVFARLNRASPPAALVRLSTPFVSGGRPAEFDRPVLTLSPDGGTIVFVGRSASGSPQLFLRKMNSTQAIPIPGTERAHTPFFSPDGSAVGFFADGNLKRVSIDTSAVQTLGSTGSYGATWTIDDFIVYGSPATGLMRLRATGGTPERLTTPTAGELAHRWPSVAPDGRTVVYATTESSGPGLEGHRIAAQSLETGRREVLPIEGTYALFAPDGRHLLVAGGGTLKAVAFDPARLTISGSAVPLIEGVMQSSTGASQVSSSASALVYLKGSVETRRLVWVDRAGNVTPLGAPPRLYVHPRLSPDGTRVAVAITEPRNAIWIWDIARSNLTLLNSEGSNAYPIWTPDGSRITYVSRQGGHPPNVFWKAVDGASAEERLETSDRPQVTESWHEKTLFFVEARAATGWDILTLSLSPRGRREILATRDLDGTPQISPTGRFLAYISNESGRLEIYVRAFPGPGPIHKVSTDGGSQAAWRRDEGELYYRTEDAMIAVPVSAQPTLRFGKPTELFRGNFASIQGKNYDVTPDGLRFLMVQSNEQVPPDQITVVLNWMSDMTSRFRAGRTP